MKARTAARRAAPARPRAAAKNILVTGADNFWGRSVAAALAAEPGCARLVLLSDERASFRPKKARTVRMDVRDPEIEEVLRRERIHTVCHLDFTEAYDRSEEAFDRNVMGTLTVLAACAEAGVKKVLLRSSVIVYGAQHNNPNFLSERRPLRGRPHLQYARDLADLERYTGEFRSRHPEVCVTLLRLAHVVGPGCDSPLMRYVLSGRVPTLMGFEPLFQVLHESDAVAAFLQALRADVPGAVNVAPDGVLPLLKLLRLAHARPVPILHPLAYAALEWMRDLPIFRGIPLDVDLLRFNCLGDNARMKAELGFQPSLDTDEAFQQAIAEARKGKENGKRSRGGEGEEGAF